MINHKTEEGRQLIASANHFLFWDSILFNFSLKVVFVVGRIPKLWKILDTWQLWELCIWIYSFFFLAILLYVLYLDIHFNHVRFYLISTSKLKSGEQTWDGHAQVKCRRRANNSVTILKIIFPLFFSSLIHITYRRDKILNICLLSYKVLSLLWMLYFSLILFATSSSRDLCFQNVVCLVKCLLTVQ